MNDAEAFPGVIRQTHRKVKVASADDAYDTKLCHEKLRRKNQGAYPAANLGGLLVEYADRNQAVVR